MKTTETVKPSIRSSKIGDTEVTRDGSGLTLKHRTRDSYPGILLVVVPLPDKLVGLLVASPAGSSLPGANVRVGFRLLFFPFLQIRLTLTEDVEDLRLATTKLNPYTHTHTHTHIIKRN